MRFLSLPSLAVAFGVALSLPARSEAVPISTVIDFNTAPTGIFTSLVVGDFTFTWVGFGDQQRVGTVGPGDNALQDSVWSNLGAEVTMSLTSGGSFTVTQFDILDLFSEGGGGRVDFGGVSYNNPGTETVLRHDLVNVTAVAINIYSILREFAVDNIHVTYDGAPGPGPSAVPEPATLTMVGLGALGMAHRLRRRKHVCSGRPASRP